MSSLLSGTLLLTGVGLFTQIVGFFYRIALSRLVGAETMGLYQLIMPAYSLLMSLTASGLTVAVSSLTARQQALGHLDAIRQTRNRALSLFFLMVLPLGTAVILLSDPISVHLLGDARTRLGLILLVPCVLLTGVENIHKHCFYGMGNPRPPAASETVEQIVRAGAVLALLLLFLPQNRERTVGLIVVGMILCEVFSTLTLLALFRRIPHVHVPSPARSFLSSAHMLSIALPVSLTSLLGTLLASANSVLIPARLVVGGMEPSQAMSSFGILCGMTMPLLALPTGFIGALCLVLVPHLARQMALGDRRATAAFLDRVMSATSLLMAPAMALLSVIGPHLATAVYGQPTAGHYMTSLAVGTLLSCYQSVLAGALNGMERQRSSAVNAILSDIVQLAFTIFAIPRWGLSAFVAGFVLSALAGAALNLFSVVRFGGLKPKWLRWFLSPLLSALLMGLCARLSFVIACDGGWPVPAAGTVACLLGIAIYLAALQAQGMLSPAPRSR